MQMCATRAIDSSRARVYYEREAPASVQRISANHRSQFALVAAAECEPAQRVSRKKPCPSQCGGLRCTCRRRLLARHRRRRCRPRIACSLPTRQHRGPLVLLGALPLGLRTPAAEHQALTRHRRQASTRCATAGDPVREAQMHPWAPPVGRPSLYASQCLAHGSTGPPGCC